MRRLLPALALLAGCGVLRPSEAAISVSNLTNDAIIAASAVGCTGDMTVAFDVPIAPGKSARATVEPGCWNVYARQSSHEARVQVQAEDGHRIDVRVRPGSLEVIP